MHSTNKLAQQGRRQLWAVTLERPYRFTSPFGGAEFAALILAQDPTMTPDEQMSVSDQLVSQGCRYALAMGLDASSWDDSVDYASIHAVERLERPEDSHVMTTWHDEEPPEEVAEWLILNTAFDDFVPANFVILCVGSCDALLERVVAAATAHFLGAG